MKAVLESKEEAQECVRKLGMHELLRSHNVLENPPTPLLDEALIMRTMMMEKLPVMEYSLSC